MQRREILAGLFGACAFLYFGTRRGVAWSLLSKDEVLKEGKASPPKAMPALSLPEGAPVIEILEPDSRQTIKSPVTVHIRFRPQRGATINPASFRAKYGWLGLDITDRLIRHAKIDASGLLAKNAEIPAGHYMVTLEITDSLGRVGARAFEFTIA